jgi:two-component system, chemotaxis family, chemotaxis protein CheY
MRTTEEDIESTIALPAVLDLAAAETLVATLRQRLAGGQPCRLDAANVEQLMLPGIQVIMAAIRSSDKVQVVNPSASFHGAFEDAALSYACGNETPLGQELPHELPQELRQELPRGFAQEHVQEHAQDPVQAQNDDPQPDRDAASVQPQSGPDIEAPMDGPRTPKRILTIDDSKTMRDMLRMTLVDAGYEVMQAVDGQDGLDVLRKERFDVVITDINMPKLDGYGVIRHLRADASYDDTPILVLSTENDQKTKDIGRDAGATGWLVKPFDPDQLVEIVRQVSP